MDSLMNKHLKYLFTGLSSFALFGGAIAAIVGLIIALIELVQWNGLVAALVIGVPLLLLMAYANGKDFYEPNLDGPPLPGEPDVPWEDDDEARTSI